MKPKILFRADGNSQMGLGHIFRSLALVDMLSSDFYCCFMTRNQLPSIHQLIIEKCDTLSILSEDLSAQAELDYLEEQYLHHYDFVVLDGYHFDQAYQVFIKARALPLVCIDDIFAFPFEADIIINHSGGLSVNDYRMREDAQCLLGPSFALLQKEFLAYSQNNTTAPSNEEVFICLGGADPHNDTLKVLQYCESMTELKSCHVVIGAAYRYKKKLEAFIQQSKIKVQLYAKLLPREMLNLMKQCGIAICPPSTIAYEYMSTRGQLYLHQTVANQSSIKSYCINSGLAFDFTEFPIRDRSRIKAAIQKQIEIFDGKSGMRLLKAFKKQMVCYQLAS